MIRRLTIDIETRPNLAYTWGLFDQTIGLAQLVEPVRMCCFAAKWHDEKKVLFFSEWADGHEGMVQAAWDLLNEAAVVIHYNGRRFDVPHLNREFVLLGLLPPAPYKQVDLCSVAKRVFAFTSNKLEFVSKALGVKSKDKHKRFPGFDLWLGIIREDPKAQVEMAKYNKIDVIATEQLYDKLLPWVPNLPSVGAMEDEDDICPACGSGDLIKEGFAYTAVGKFARFHCADCGKWSRSSKRVGGTNITAVVQ